MAVSRTWYAFSCKKTHLGRRAGMQSKREGWKSLRGLGGSSFLPTLDDAGTWQGEACAGGVCPE